MTLADRLDALLTRPIYECDLETIREAAKRLRALETGSGAKTDIVERLRTAANNNRIAAARGTTATGEILTAIGCQTKECVAEMHVESADEIDRLRVELDSAKALAVTFIGESDRLRTERSELIEALEACKRAMRAIGNNIAEFGSVTDQEYWDALWEAEAKVLAVLSKIKEQKA